MRDKISSTLDAIADSLEAKGLIKEAYEIDKIADMYEGQMGTPPATSKMDPSKAMQVLDNATPEQIGAVLEQIKQSQQGIGGGEREAALSGISKAIFMALMALAPALMATEGGVDKLQNQLAIKRADFKANQIVQMDNQEQNKMKAEVSKTVAQIKDQIENAKINPGRAIVRPIEIGGKSYKAMNEEQIKISAMIKNLSNRMGALVSAGVISDQVMQSTIDGLLSSAGMQAAGGTQSF